MSNDPSAVSELPDKDSLDNGISNDNERTMGGNGNGGDGLRLPRTTGTLNVNALQKGTNAAHEAGGYKSMDPAKNAETTNDDDNNVVSLDDPIQFTRVSSSSVISGMSSSMSPHSNIDETKSL